MKNVGWENETTKQQKWIGQLNDEHIYDDKTEKSFKTVQGQLFTL